MKILLFGVLIDAIGEKTIEMDTSPDANSLKENLMLKHPILRSYNFVIAINKQIDYSDMTINEGDEIALLPPFAGG
ncbi:MAG: MoaD/ThiS family protein [Bacteroidota bacterium]